ncbi:triose-phosphate isomerase family protein [Streptomyces pinistramenti]|uniref:triose-phosphate isomerase family protein n=1 Tax=Streptomyces pinistramenti TaxID=2884812 RepID=UPI001D0893CB|nr:triose-phosphate isomerase family protein [Streptomyces pinistramenti]MCB5910227.1 triose-phosphate isomerase [Streptomyces pinistramenti]
MIPENSTSTEATRPVVGVSLKLYFGLAQTRAWLADVAALNGTLATLPRPVDLFVLPAFPALADARELLAGTGVRYGAQDVHWAETGAWTGEVSAGMLTETGARYVEVGHAERRRHFGETDETVAAKTRAATHAGLIPVICAGERRADTLDGAVEETLTQVRAALCGAAPGSEVVIAYEPVWAIGAREAAPAGHVRAVAAAIRGALRDHDVRGRLIYGGTAGPGTYTELAGAVDGLFLGRLAHDTEGLRKVIEEIAGS